jgi:hypothetical protein
MTDTTAPATDVSAWSRACATGKHGLCTGYVINPDPDAPADQVRLRCECNVQATHKGKHGGEPARVGRPRKTPAAD